MTLDPGRDADTSMLSGEEQLRAIMRSGRRPPMLEAIDADLVELEPGYAVFAASPDRRFENPMGAIHGGYIATLLDSACGCAVHSKLTAAQAFTTLELKVAYHRAIRAGAGPLRAVGTLKSFGRRVGFAEATLTGPDGALYASATSTLILLER